MTDLQEQPDDFNERGSSELSASGGIKFVSRSQYSVRDVSAVDCDFQPHSHSAFTVTVILSGEMTATVGGDELLALAGQTVFTGISEVHAARAQHVEFVSVAICAELISELLVDLAFASDTSQITFREKLVIDEIIVAIARLIRSEIDDQKPGRGQMLDALIRQLAIHLVRSQFKVRKSARMELSRVGPVDRRLRRAIEFMHDNYSRELALEDIAGAAYLSEYHFARLFKRITGVTPGAYLANLRIERGRQLLAETLLPISEIAAMVGYQSQSHFTKIFKSVTGVTPRVYRDGHDDSPSKR